MPHCHLNNDDRDGWTAGRLPPVAAQQDQRADVRTRLHLAPSPSPSPSSNTPSKPHHDKHAKRTRTMRSPMVPTSAPNSPSLFLKPTRGSNSSSSSSSRAISDNNSPNPRARKVVRRVLSPKRTNVPNRATIGTTDADQSKPQHQHRVHLPKFHPRRSSLSADASLVAQAKAHGWDRPLQPEPPVQVIWVDPPHRPVAAAAAAARPRRSGRMSLPVPPSSNKLKLEEEHPDADANTSSRGAIRVRQARHTLKPRLSLPRRSLLPSIPVPSSPSDDPMLLRSTERRCAPRPILPIVQSPSRGKFTRSTSATGNDWAPVPVEGVLGSDPDDSEDEDPEQSFTTEALEDLRFRTAQLSSAPKREPSSRLRSQSRSPMVETSGVMKVHHQQQEPDLDLELGSAEARGDHEGQVDHDITLDEGGTYTFFH